MKPSFRKLAHMNEDESVNIRVLRVRVSVVSFMLECSIKYNNEKQINICRSELEILKDAYEACLESIFARTGKYPSNGKVEVHRSGDVMEYFR